MDPEFISPEDWTHSKDTDTDYLRDTFAAAALTGLLAGADDEYPKVMAASAYKHADAMLAARLKKA